MADVDRAPDQFANSIVALGSERFVEHAECNRCPLRSGVANWEVGGHGLVAVILRQIVVETIVVRWLFWKRSRQPNTQGFRIQLESLTRELRLQLGEVHDADQSLQLLHDLNTLESSYLGDLRELQRRTKHSNVLR